MNAYELIEAERHRQIELGWSEEHDEMHDVGHFALLIEKQLNDLKKAWYESEPGEMHHRLVTIGAVAVAALEAKTNG